MTEFQDRGEALRQAAGIDGTAGDAQDIPHGYVRDDETGVCLLCGLAEGYRKHTITNPPLIVGMPGGVPVTADDLLAASQAAAPTPCDCELDTEDCTDPAHKPTRYEVHRLDQPAVNADGTLTIGYCVPVTTPPPVDPPASIDDCSSDTYDAMRARLAELERRLDESVWRRQGALLDRQAKQLGDQAAVITRATELARRWEHVPGKQDAARQLLTALGLRKERE